MALTFVWPVMVAVLTAASVQYAMGDGDCGGHFTVSSSLSRFESPNYGNGNYPNNADCKWTFETENGDGMYIVIQKTDIQGRKYNCENDYIKISPLDGVVQRICGDNSDSHIIYTRKSTMEARFVSDSDVTAGGFKAYAKARSQENLESILFEDNGEIESPISDKRPYWEIYAPWGHGIKITFTKMDFPNGPEGECGYNSEIILVHRSGQESENEGHFCHTSEEPIEISIDEPYASISMYDYGEDRSSFQSSFSATYEFYQLSA